MRESSSDISQSKDTKETRPLRTEATRKSGMELKETTIGIKMIPAADTATASQNTKEIGTMENSRTTSTVGPITKTTSMATTLTSKKADTMESNREDTEESNKTTTDTTIEEELSSIRITSSLPSLAMMMKKASQRSTSWAKETPINL